MKDRSVQVDLMLAFAATFVITLAFWPQASPRQVLHCRVAETEWKTYSIPVADPSLADIKSRLYRWQTPEFDRRYVTAKWQMEVARFYQQSASQAQDAAGTEQAQRQPDPTTFRISDRVATVAFELPVPPEAPTAESAANAAVVRSAEYIEQETAAGETSPYGATRQSGLANILAGAPQDPHYWSRVIEQAERSIQATLQRTENAPVVLGDVRRSGWPALAFHFALLFGLAVACGYMHWYRIARLDNQLPFKEQSTWVLARLGTFGGLVSFAVVCLLTLWI